MFVPSRCKVNVQSYSWPIEKFSKKKFECLTTKKHNVTVLRTVLRSPQFRLSLVSYDGRLFDESFYLWLTQDSVKGGEDGESTVACPWLRLSLRHTKHERYPSSDEIAQIKTDQRNQCIAWISGSQKERLCKLIGGQSYSFGYFFSNPQFVLYDDLLDRGKHLLCADKLIIECEMHTLINEVRYVDSWLFDPLQPAVVHLNVPEHSLTSDLRQILATGQNSDVVLVASDGKEYPAHAAILSSRSTVFAAMFKHNMKEKHENRVKIEDLSSELIEGLLNFIYTDTVPDITNAAPDLLAVADKYSIPSLTVLCEGAMVSDLKVENAAEFLMLADSRRALQLRTVAKHFTITHLKEVKVTEGWKKLVEHSPHLVDEIIDEFAELMDKLTSQPSLFEIL